jgi:hypothetical protein
MKTNTRYKVKRLAALAALAALVMTGCENPGGWNEAPEARSVGQGSGTLDPVCIKGTLYTAIDPVGVVITLNGNTFAPGLTAGTDVTSWFTNLPAGLSAVVASSTGQAAAITLSGRPGAPSSFWIEVSIPASALTPGSHTITIPGTSSAVYDIRWPYPNWEHSEVFPKGAVNSAAYGEGVFVVGSRVAGEVAYSRDNGRTWTIVPLWSTGTNDWVSVVVYIDGAFYAGGNYGMLAGSPDGKTWTIIGKALLNGEDIRTIAYGCGITIIAGTSGQAAQTTGYPTVTSNWTPVSIFGTTDTINSIAFGADTGGAPLFVATAQGAHSAYFYPSAGTWVSTTNQTAAIFSNPGGQTSIKMVAYDPKNHKFVIVGFHQAAYAVPAPGSFTWTGVNLTNIVGITARTGWLTCVTFGGKYFIAGGSNGQSFSSVDGINWALTGAGGQFSLPSSDIPFVKAIAYGGDEQAPKFLITGGFDNGPGIAAFNVIRFKDGKEPVKD